MKLCIPFSDAGLPQSDSFWSETEDENIRPFRLINFMIFLSHYIEPHIRHPHY